MHDVLNSVCTQLLHKVELAVDDFVVDDTPPLDRKGCCLAFNYTQDQLAYIPIARIDRFKDGGGQYWKLFDAEYRKNLAVQSSVRKCLVACGIALEENHIVNIEKLCNTPVLDFKIISSGIDAIYNMPRCGLRGSLENSCMQGQSTDFFTLYEQSPFCRLLVAMDKEGKLAGRALLWESASGAILCDRRYGANFYVEEALTDYALAQGFFVKTNNNYQEVTSWRSKDSTLNAEQRVKMIADITAIGSVPFCDTFQWADGDFLYSYSAGEYRLNSMSGYLSDYSDDNSECYGCGAEHHLDDMCHIDGDYYCDDCCFFCEDCDYSHAGNDYITLPSGGAICSYCQEHYTVCSECDDYAHNDSMRHFTNCEVNLCQECIA